MSLINATGFAIDPNAGDSAQFFIVFNASDPDGAGDINGTLGGRVTLNVTLGSAASGNQFRTESSCTNSTQKTSLHIVVFNCTINMKYYDNASTKWVINITVEDSAGAITRNDSSNENTPHRFTYNSLSSFSITTRDEKEGAVLNFSSLNLGAQNQPAKAPLLLNNTGNEDFEQINITAANLVGVTDDTKTIAASSFFVNATNITAGAGAPLSTTGVTIRALEQPATDSVANVTLWHGPGISGDTVPYAGATLDKGNQTLVFWIDVPTGLSSQVYNNTWNMTVINLP